MRDKRTRPEQQSQANPGEAMQEIRGMIEQIRRCEALLSDGSNEGTGRLSGQLLAKADRLSRLRRRRVRPESAPSSDRNNNKCCSGRGQGTAIHEVQPETRDASLESCDQFPVSDQLIGEASVESLNSSLEEGPLDSVVGGGQGRGKNDSKAKSAAGGKTDSKTNQQAEDGGQGRDKADFKHQEYCLCHKRKCNNCGSLCPCSEHACPGCGSLSRVVMTMRSVNGLKTIAEAQKCRYRNGKVVRAKRCRTQGKRFLMNENPITADSSGECAHSVMVRVGGGFVPLVEYLKSHNKVVLSKFTRCDGSAFLSPWQPHYPGPLRKGRPRGIRYVDSVTQQLEELIFANKEVGKSTCVCT